MSSIIEISFNGELRAVKSRDLVSLLAEFGLQDIKLAIELNREIIPRSLYASTSISAGDQLEIVTFVGGG